MSVTFNKCKKKFGILFQVKFSLKSLRSKLENRKKLKKVESILCEREKII